MNRWDTAISHTMSSNSWKEISSKVSRFDAAARSTLAQLQEDSALAPDTFASNPMTCAAHRSRLFSGLSRQDFLRMLNILHLQLTREEFGK